MEQPTQQTPQAQPTPAPQSPVSGNPPFTININTANSPTAPTAVAVPHRGKAIAGMVLGIIGLVFWIIPIIGYPVTIVGIIMSAIGLKSDKKGQAVAGLVMSIIGLVATLINSIMSVLMWATLFST